MFSLTVMNSKDRLVKVLCLSIDLALCLVLYVKKSAEIWVPLIFGVFSFISKVFTHVL